MKPIEPGCWAILIEPNHDVGAQDEQALGYQVGKVVKVLRPDPEWVGAKCGCTVWWCEPFDNSDASLECCLLRIDGHDELTRLEDEALPA